MTNTTNPAQTLAERQAAYRQRQRAAGLKELRQLWADPADHDAIRAYVARLAVKRSKGTR